jgi:general secretion pathway protein A
MYESYWGLNCRPFDSGLDDFYYPCEAHQGALLKLRYTIENRRGAALLAGPAGVGKTLLVGALERQLPESFAPFVHLVFPQMPGPQLLIWLAEEMGAGNLGGNATVEASVRALSRAFAQNCERGRHAVVAIDEAHLLSEANTLETVRLLLNFEHQGAPALTLLLVGQPSLLPALDRMPGLEERMAVKCLLRPLNLEETVSYVNHRLKSAGAERTIFENEALEAIFYLTRGLPRRINRLCDLALLIGFAEEQATLGATQIESVSQELVTVSPE